MEKQEIISKLSEKVIQSIVNPELADELKSVGFDEYAPFRYVYGLFVECDSQQRIW